MINILRKNNIKISIGKCKILQTSIDFLGHVLSKGSIKNDPKRAECIKNMPLPTSLKELQRALGSVNGKKVMVKWTEESVKSFNNLKEIIRSDLMLATPDFELPFELTTDASDHAYGAILEQIVEDIKWSLDTSLKGTQTSRKDIQQARKNLLL